MDQVFLRNLVDLKFDRVLNSIRVPGCEAGELGWVLVFSREYPHRRGTEREANRRARLPPRRGTEREASRGARLPPGAAKGARSAKPARSATTSPAAMEREASRRARPTPGSRPAGGRGACSDGELHRSGAVPQWICNRPSERDQGRQSSARSTSGNAGRAPIAAAEPAVKAAPVQLRRRGASLVPSPDRCIDWGSLDKDCSCSSSSSVSNLEPSQGSLRREISSPFAPYACAIFHVCSVVGY